MALQEEVTALRKAARTSSVLPSVLPSIEDNRTIGYKGRSSYRPMRNTDAQVLIDREDPSFESWKH